MSSTSITAPIASPILDHVACPLLWARAAPIKGVLYAHDVQTNPNIEQHRAGGYHLFEQLHPYGFSPHYTIQTLFSDGNHILECLQPAPQRATKRRVTQSLIIKDFKELLYVSLHAHNAQNSVHINDWIAPYNHLKLTKDVIYLDGEAIPPCTLLIKLDADMHAYKNLLYTDLQLLIGLFRTCLRQPYMVCHHMPKLAKTLAAMSLVDNPRINDLLKFKKMSLLQTCPLEQATLMDVFLLGLWQWLNLGIPETRRHNLMQLIFTWGKSYGFNGRAILPILGVESNDYKLFSMVTGIYAPDLIEPLMQAVVAQNGHATLHDHIPTFEWFTQVAPKLRQLIPQPNSITP